MRLRKELTGVRRGAADMAVFVFGSRAHTLIMKQKPLIKLTRLQCERQKLAHLRYLFTPRTMDAGSLKTMPLAQCDAEA